MNRREALHAKFRRLDRWQTRIARSCIVLLGIGLLAVPPIDETNWSDWYRGMIILMIILVLSLPALALFDRIGRPRCPGCRKSLMLQDDVMATGKCSRCGELLFPAGDVPLALPQPVAERHSWVRFLRDSAPSLFLIGVILICYIPAIIMARRHEGPPPADAFLSLCGAAMICYPLISIIFHRLELLSSFPRCGNCNSVVRMVNTLLLTGNCSACGAKVSAEFPKPPFGEPVIDRRVVEEYIDKLARWSGKMIVILLGYFLLTILMFTINQWCGLAMIILLLPILLLNVYCIDKRIKKPDIPRQCPDCGAMLGISRNRSHCLNCGRRIVG